MSQGDGAVRASGGCLCGAVRYEVRGPLRDVVNCHCGQCRRTTGHHGAFAATAADDLTVTEDRGLKWYKSSDIARRAFCAECGSTLFWQPGHKRHTAIAAGSFDQPTGLRTTGNIFTEDAGDYYAIDSGLECWPGSMAGD